MKIVIATGLYPPQIGGPATYAKLLVDELPKRGFEVDVVNFGDFLHLPKVIRHIVFGYKLFKKSKGADVIFGQDPVSVGLPALFVSRLRGTFLVLRLAGDYAWEQARGRLGVIESIDDFQSKKYGPKVQLLRFIQKFVARRANKVVTPSYYFGSIISGWGVSDSKLSVIYNGIKIPEKIISKEEAIKNLEISENAFSIVSAGRLVPWKGFKNLIDVVSEIKKEEKSVELFIIGDGPDYEKLVDYINEKEVSDFIKIVGSVDREKVMEYLSACDVFALNTSFESFSFQIVEAMSVGAPVVATNIGNLPEIVKGEESGLLLEPDNKNEWKKAFLDLINSEHKRQSLGQEGKKRSLDFSISKTMDSLTKTLKDL